MIKPHILKKTGIFLKCGRKKCAHNSVWTGKGKHGTRSGLFVSAAILFTAFLAFSDVKVQGEEEKTTVVFWNNLSGEEGDTMDALVDKFNSQSTDVYIDMTRTESLSDMLQSHLPSGDAADLVLMGVKQIAHYGGYLRNMEDIWENTELRKEDFISAYLELCYDGSSLFALPFQTTTYMMYYNRELLEQAGVETVPATFDQWTAVAEAVSTLSSGDTPVYGSGLVYSYAGRSQALIQRFGTGYLIEGNRESGYTANLLENGAFANAVIWMKNLYDSGSNPLIKNTDTMMADGQIGLTCGTGTLKKKLEEAGLSYGIAPLPVADGADPLEYALGDLTGFMITTSATEKEVAAAEKFLEWWMTGEGLEASDITDGINYSGVTPNTEWSLSMFCVNAYLPAVNSEAYQEEKALAALTPEEDARIQMYTAYGNLCYNDAANCAAEYIQDWICNGPVNPDYEDVQKFFANYQMDLEEYISDYY